MDESYIKKLQEMYIEEQAKLQESVKHLLSPTDEILGTGNARVENYPGRRRPLHPHEDFMGYLVATTSSLIYTDNFGEIVIPFRDIKKIKSEPFPLPATLGLSIVLDNLYAYFSAQESFAVAISKSFKQGMWAGERAKNPKSRKLLSRLLGKNNESNEV